jgi:hypothetical protein
MIYKVILTNLKYLITKDKQILTKKSNLVRNIQFLGFIVSIIFVFLLYENKIICLSVKYTSYFVTHQIQYLKDF